MAEDMPQLFIQPLNKFCVLYMQRLARGGIAKLPLEVADLADLYIYMHESNRNIPPNQKNRISFNGNNLRFMWKYDILDEQTENTK